MAAADFVADIPGLHSAERGTDLVLLGDATEEQVIFRAPFRCRVQSVTVTPDADVTGDNSNRKNLNIVNKGSDGNGTTEVASLDLVTAVNLDQADGTVIPLTAGEILLAEGDVLAVEIEQVGTGVTIPRSGWETKYLADISGV